MSPDNNSIENLCGQLKSDIEERYLANIQDLEHIDWEDWEKMPVEVSETY